MMSPEQARGGSDDWYAMELTEQPHVAGGLNITRDKATRDAGLTAEL
jgi:hypothetical protein